MLLELIIFAGVFAMFLMVAMVMAVIVSAHIMTSESYMRKQTKTMMNITRELTESTDQD